MNKEYLGDSVYVEDGAMIRLTTENGGSPSNEIFLEAETLQALILWCQRHGWIAPREKAE